jgi:multiple sugar transport system permease protein
MLSNWQRLIYHAGIISICLIFLLPLYWMVVTSLREVGAPPPSTIEWWQPNPQWQNYRQLFEIVPIRRYLRNSLIVVATAVPITVISASVAGFALSQLGDKWRGRLLYTSIGLLIIPSASVWIFRFQILQWLGLLDSLWAIVVPSIAGTSPLYTLLFYWTYRRIPVEISEAALLDGASAITIWARILTPMTQPTGVAVIVLSFVHYWSDFVTPVLYIFNPDFYTLPIGLQIIKQLDATNWALLMAGATIMTLPVILLFIFLQRAFLSNNSLASLLERN